MSEREHKDDSAENDKEIAWLLACERGHPGPMVSDATAARYAQLKLLIAMLPTTPTDVAACGGWQRRVLDAIEAKEMTRDAGRGEGRHAATSRRPLPPGAR